MKFEMIFSFKDRTQNKCENDSVTVLALVGSGSFIGSIGPIDS